MNTKKKKKNEEHPHQTRRTPHYRKWPIKTNPKKITNQKRITRSARCMAFHPDLSVPS